MQNAAMCCNVLQHTAPTFFNSGYELTVQENDKDAATHCNTLQHTATHCHTQQHAAMHCNTLPHAATRCNALQHTAARSNTLQHVLQWI